MHSTTSGPTRRVRSTMAVLGLVAVAVATLAACQPPINPNNRPSAPVGVTNGAIPAAQLAVVNGCQVHSSARNGLLGLLMFSGSEGISLYPTSCYRDYNAQVAARDSWCARGACHMAATPGYSNHGWGKAVDFGTNGGMTFDSPAYKWLTNNAWRMGWNHPGWAKPEGSSPEAWHWEWVGDGGTLYPGTTIGPQP